MSRYVAHSNLIVRNISSKEGLIAFLTDLADFDADFNGENDDELLWEDARKEGYSSNAEYAANKAIDEWTFKNPTLQDICDTYAKIWKAEYYESLEIFVERTDSTIPGIDKNDTIYGTYAAICIATYIN